MEHKVVHALRHTSCIGIAGLRYRDKLPDIGLIGSNGTGFIDTLTHIHLSS